MNSDDRLRRKKKAKLSSAYFTQEYLGYTLAPFQKELHKIIKHNNKVLFTVSRNTGKTDVVLAPIIMHTHLFNPDKSSLLTSRSNDLIKKVINYIDSHFQNNEKIQTDFAYELRDYKRTNNDLIFNTNYHSSKQYTIEARSIDSNLTGNHYDYLFCDDLEDDKSVLTAHSRQKTKDFYNTTISPLLNPDAKQVASGTFKHLDDIYNSWIKSKTWFHYNAPVAYKMPDSWDIVYDKNGVAVDVSNINGEYKLLFPERWSIKNIILKVAEIGRTAFEREYQNNIKALQNTTLKLDWIQKCAITKKAAEKYDVELIPPLQNLEIYQGVDLAIGEKEQNDYFVCETIGVQRVPEFKIFVLDWYRDKLNFPLQIETLKKLRYSSLNPIWMGTPWNVLLTKIESNAYQLAASQQLIATTDMNIVAETSTGNKEARIIANSVKFQNGQIWLPLDHPEYKTFEREYSDFPKGAHDDTLDAHVFATTSIADITRKKALRAGKRIRRK